MGIEEFLDWLADIDRFFDYMKIPSEKRVRLVAYRLKGVRLHGGRDCRIRGSEKGKREFELGLG